MALPQAIDIHISMLRLAPQCFAFTSIYTHTLSPNLPGYGFPVAGGLISPAVRHKALRSDDLVTF